MKQKTDTQITLSRGGRHHEHDANARAQPTYGKRTDTDSRVHVVLYIQSRAAPPPPPFTAVPRFPAVRSWLSMRAACRGAVGEGAAGCRRYRRASAAAASATAQTGRRCHHAKVQRDLPLGVPRPRCERAAAGWAAARPVGRRAWRVATSSSDARPLRRSSAAATEARSRFE